MIFSKSTKPIGIKCCMNGFCSVLYTDCSFHFDSANTLSPRAIRYSESWMPFPNLLWKYETDWNQALHKHKFIISFWFGEKHGRHGKFILIGWNFQNLWNNTSNWNWFAVWYNIVRSSFSFDPTKQYCSHVPFLILNGWNIIKNLLWNCYVTWN